MVLWRSWCGIEEAIQVPAITEIRTGILAYVFNVILI